MGSIDPSDGKRSLREAITATNNRVGADVIVLPAGIFKITIPGALEGNNASGDFDVRDSLTIRGTGAGATAVEGQQLDRVFDVFGTEASSIRVVLEGLTVRNGSATGLTGDGGGVRVGDPDLVVRDCVVAGNRASENGGGVSNGLQPETGNVKLVRTAVARNVAGGVGGGLSVFGSSLLTIKDSTVRRNISASAGGGIFALTAALSNSIVGGNTAETDGGGIDVGTRIFALLGMAMGDAAIAGWDTKYLHNLWRPLTAIRAGDLDGNSRTSGIRTGSRCSAPQRTRATCRAMRPCPAPLDECSSTPSASGATPSL